MTVPIWAYPHLHVNNWTAAPAALVALHYPHYHAVHLHLIDGRDEAGNHVPVTKEYVRSLKARGFAVFGVVGDYALDHNPWEDWLPPLELLADSIAELGLHGAVPNFEDVWENHDKLGHGWSAAFTDQYRQWFPRKALAINTYDECGFVDFKQWAEAGARCYLQSYKGSVEPPATIGGHALRTWLQAWGWPAKLIGRFRPCLGVFRGSSGVRVTIPAQVDVLRGAGSQGYVAYYAEGADIGDPDSYLRPLAQAAKEAGCAK